MAKLRVIFAGTPEFSARHLGALIDSDTVDIVAVYTQPDRKAGRGKKLTASPVKQLAIEHGIEVEQPNNFKVDGALAKLSSYRADVMIVVAYGLILPQAVLDIPTFGCINVHASILPRWRGAAPIQRAIEAGDAQTGITIMQMELGLDTGPMLEKVVMDISPTTTGGELHDQLIEIGCPALVKTLENLACGALTPEVQDDTQANYAHKLSKLDAKINWHKSAAELDRKIRAFSPFPTAWFEYGDNAIRVHKAEVVNKSGVPGTVLSYDRKGLIVASGEKALIITKMQLPGKKTMTIADIFNGSPTVFKVGGTLD